MCGIFAAGLIHALPAHATTPPPVPQQWQLDGSKTPPAAPIGITFEDALADYQAGRYEDALAKAKLAGANGDSGAQVLAGTMLMNGEAGLINDREAVDWFRRAAGAGNMDGQLLLGKMALKSRGGLTPRDALSPFRQAAKAGNVEAHRAIGEMYQKGIGVPKDPATAQLWLGHAAGSGNTSGAKKMGDSLIESDPKRALKYYEQAAQDGNAEAAYVAAVMYVENYDIRPNAARAAVLLRQAADAGIAGAQADYGLLVYQGAGVEQSTQDAAVWFKKSAIGGDREGQFLYAFTLAKGEGVTRNFEEAYYWLLKSDKAGRSGAGDYDQDRAELKRRLETNVDVAVLNKARARIGAGQ